MPTTRQLDKHTLEKSNPANLPTGRSYQKMQQEIDDLETRAGVIEQQLGKNLLINSDMRIDQRDSNGTPVSFTSGGAYGPDRWKGVIHANLTNDPKLSKETLSLLDGFDSYLRVTNSVSGDTAIVNEYCLFEQAIEGYNFAHLRFGTNLAKNVALSFWVRSSVAGIYCASLKNEALNRSYITEITINLADTWEYKTIIISGDVTGTWEIGNTKGLVLSFDLGSGPDLNNTADVWTDTGDVRTTNQTNWISNGSATFDLTGVQLEFGDIATEFEYRNYSAELALCQYYYWKIIWGVNQIIGEGYMFSTSAGRGSIKVPKMRTTGTAAMSAVSDLMLRTTTGLLIFVSGLSLTHVSNADIITLGATVSPTGTAGQGGELQGNAADGWLEIDAEL